MRRPSERTILLALLRMRGKQPLSRLHQFAFDAVAWLAIAAVTFGLCVTYGTPKQETMLVASISLLMGVATGAMAMIRVSREQWPVIDRHLDFERIEASLSELKT